ncbi:MAG TPA: M13 family metallopeptidase [Terriglobales bacterium]|nr:M13 family metallopeptidase [Terriglobales bacterium]
MAVGIVVVLFAGFMFAQTAGSNTAVRFDVKNMDTTVDPCVDFYRYACGGWMANNPIPGDQSRWGRFNQLAENNLAILHDILEGAAKPDPGRNAIMQKIGDHYASCMDEAAVNKLGISPLKPTFDRIAKIKTHKDLITTVAYLHSNGIPSLFGMFAQPDMHNAQSMIAFVDQGGLTLPDRDYYLKDDAKSKETREKYVAHVQKMMELAGEKPADAAAQAKIVMEMETELARASMDRTARRNPANRDHKMTAKELYALAPNFMFAEYFKLRAVPSVETLNTVNPDFFKKVDGMLGQVPLGDWKVYLRWKALNDAAPLLSQPFVDEDFAFNRQYMSGQKENAARWKRCVRRVDAELPELLGQPYVEKNFPADSKKRTLELVKNVEGAMGQDFKSLDWMSDQTKKQAQVKLDAIRNHIGYPDKWRDYSTVEIKRGDLLGNSTRAAAFEVKRNLNKIGKPVDRDEWSMSPPTVNAYYRPSMNDINFPAGILQPPFFDPTIDDAVNYGGIGAVIGHELTHGFDDQGSQFDAEGNFNSWWTKEDRAEFDKRTGCLADQYGQFVAVDDVTLNGKLTLGENTADNGGVKISLMALNEALKGKAMDKIDGFTPQQRFFLGYAQIWCQNVTPESSRLLAKTDPHSPGKYRVNGVVQNSAEFQSAFGCKTGQPMVRENACRVW